MLNKSLKEEFRSSSKFQMIAWGLHPNFSEVNARMINNTLYETGMTLLNIDWTINYLQLIQK